MSRAALEEVEAAREVLNAGQEADWEERNKALVRLQALVQTGPGRDALAASFERLRKPLALQLEDLRSMVVKEVCATLCVLVAEMGSSFDQHVEFFFPKLLRLTAVKTQVMSQSAHQVLQAIVAHTTPGATLPSIEANVASKNAIERARCVEYLAAILKDKSRGEGLERFRDGIFNAIETAMPDASPEVRSFARSSFWRCHAIWPERANQLLDTLDSAAQRALARDRAASNAQPARATVSSVARKRVHPKDKAEVKKVHMPRQSLQPLEFAQPPEKTEHALTCSFDFKPAARFATVAGELESLPQRNLVQWQDEVLAPKSTCVVEPTPLTDLNPESAKSMLPLVMHEPATKTAGATSGVFTVSWEQPEKRKRKRPSPPTPADPAPVDAQPNDIQPMESVLSVAAEPSLNVSESAQDTAPQNILVPIVENSVITPTEEVVETSTERTQDPSSTQGIEPRISAIVEALANVQDCANWQAYIEEVGLCNAELPTNQRLTAIIRCIIYAYVEGKRVDGGRALDMLLFFCKEAQKDGNTWGDVCTEIVVELASGGWQLRHTLRLLAQLVVSPQAITSTGLSFTHAVLPQLALALESECCYVRWAAMQLAVALSAAGVALLEMSPLRQRLLTKYATEHAEAVLPRQSLLAH